jgi:hypothetical protein
MNKHVVSLALATALSAGVASAQSTFEALLSGLNETTPNASPATGFGTVVLNAAQTQITVDESWSGLLASATASHIHGPAGVGTNAAVMFPFTGVPAATSGSIPQQVFAITPTEVAYLQSGLLYMNIHTSVFPGGEIRGQLVLVPEPSAAALLALGAGATALALRRRKVAPPA